MFNQLLKKCVICHKMQSRPPKETMSDIPTEHVTPARPFSKLGLTFAGPFIVKDTESKIAHIAVFVCLAQKAVQIEVASSLANYYYVFLLRRFVWRLGAHPKSITDNGTKFTRSKIDLNESQVILRETKSIESLNKFKVQGIEWIAIKPRALQFGEMWKAAVKSMKKQLR